MMRIATAAWLALAGAAAGDDGELEGGALNGERFRVFITTDIGGLDDDDFQSLFHYFMYGDIFDTEGIVASPPGDGTVGDIHRMIDLYAADYPKLAEKSKQFPSPAYYRAISKQGTRAAPFHANSGFISEGAKWLAECGARPDLDGRPLYVLVWGSITDVAYALLHKPSIAPNLRVIYLAGWNEFQDPQSIQYIESNYKDLWIIQDMYGFQGLRLGGN